MRKILGLVLALVGSFTPVFAQSHADIPELRSGDLWEFQRTDLSSKQVTGKYAIQVTGKHGTEYAITTAREGSTGILPVALTEHLGRVTAYDGQRSDNGWLNFPLVAGKTWKASDNWKNRNGNTGSDNITYHVIASETISVPAGDFETIKIVGEGWWNNFASKNSGKIEIQFWYSPAVKTIVKYERKDYFRNEVDLNSSTSGTFCRQRWMAGVGQQRQLTIRD